MQIAVALLAGGFVFFAGFCLGLYPPAGNKAAKSARTLLADQNKFYRNFLSYDGEIQP